MPPSRASPRQQFRADTFVDPGRDSAAVPRLTLPSLLEKLAARPPFAVIFLHGEEEFLRDDAVQKVVDAMLDPGMAAFNLDQLRGGDVTPETLGSVLATPPMMTDYRVVVVRDVQSMTPKSREVVEALLARPSPGVVVVLVGVVPGGSKAKFYDTLKAQALSIEFPALHPHDLPGWVLDHGREAHNVEIDLDAARALSAAIGSQLGVLASEVEKAVAYAGDKGRVTLDDVKAVGGYIPRVDRWGWFDKVGDRRFESALEELPLLLDAGENAVGLVIGITSHILKLGLAVSGGEEGLQRALRPNQRWLGQRLLPQARKWTAARIDAALADLLRTDRLLKTASLNDRQAMEELLLRLSAETVR